MFLPTASSGRVPALRHQGPVRRQLRELRRRLRAHRTEEPFRVLSAPRPSCASDHHFFPLSDPRCVGLPGTLDARGEACSPAEQDQSGSPSTKTGKGWPRRLGHQPRRAVLRHRDPRRAGQILLRLADAPVGYLASLKNATFAKTAGHGRLPGRPDHRSRSISSAKDIITFHTCSGRRCCTSAAARCRTTVFVHGFLTVNNGEKMSKSRGTGIDPCQYLELGHGSRMAALLPGRQAQRPRRRPRLQRRGLHRPRQQRPGRQVHQHRQPRGGLCGQAFDGVLAADLGAEGEA